MCRLLGYLGAPVKLDYLLTAPENSLFIQSYQPREMTSGLLNADGFGFGWYDRDRDTRPFTYRSTQPIWSEANFASLGRYIKSHCILASVRSATPGQAVDISNCQPFHFESLLAHHNGFIDNFRSTLYRPIRDSLEDPYYRMIDGSTDSEHIFAYVLNTWDRQGGTLEAALATSIETLAGWAYKESVSISINMLLSDGERLIASRFSNRSSVPTLYWLRDNPFFPGAVVVASERLFEAAWVSLPPSSILTVGTDLDVKVQQLAI